MTLALAQVFIDTAGRYKQILSIQNFVQWLVYGRFSTTDSAWDVGQSTRTALMIWMERGINDLEHTQRVIDQRLDREEASGNGSLMRISPIGVALWVDCGYARQVARQHSLITHPAAACVEACEAYTDLICKAMEGPSYTVSVFIQSSRSLMKA